MMMLSYFDYIIEKIGKKIVFNGIFVLLCDDGWMERRMHTVEMLR
jgi:hypothetical protein